MHEERGMARIVQKPLGSIDPGTGNFIEWIRGETCWRDETQVFQYCESVGACRLVKGRLDRFVLPNDALLGGRFFEEESRTDIRWRLGADGKVTAWLTKELSADESEVEVEGVDVGFVERRFYLIGRWNEHDQEWREARYPNAQLDHPVQATENDSRAYIIVREYEPAKPTWNGEIERQLNQPRVLAHRFVTVGVGKD